MAKVIFLHLSVILFTGGVSASVHAWIPSARSRHPPRSRHTPEQTPPGAYTRPPNPRSRHPPPPPQEQTPPGSRLRHTVNERPVRILLERILVDLLITFSDEFLHLARMKTTGFHSQNCVGVRGELLFATFFSERKEKTSVRKPNILNM